MKLVWAATAALLFAFTTPALAGNPHCAMTARVALGGAQMVYDPFAPLNTAIDLEVIVENPNDKQCNARIYAGPLNGDLRLSSGTSYLLYRVEGANGGGSILPNGFGPFIAHVPAKGSRTVRMQFTLPAQQVALKGDYESQLIVRGLSEGNEPIDFTSENAWLRVRVPARVEMSISGTAASSLADAGMRPASIEFGQAHSGQTGRVFVNVWSNGSVNVSLDSENHGVLAHIENRALPPIPYSATFDGSPANLTSTYVVQRTPPLSTKGASYKFEVKLGDLSGKFAGRYKDIVTINVNQN